MIMISKGIWLGLIAAAFIGGTVFSTDLATAAKPITEVFVTNDRANPISSVCPADSIQHWDKIIFQVTLGDAELSFIEPAGATKLKENMEYDIKVLDNPKEVADLRQKTADKLNDLGYKKQTIQFPTTIKAFNIEIIDVEYAITCASGVTTPRR